MSGWMDARYNGNVKEIYYVLPEGTTEAELPEVPEQPVLPADTSLTFSLKIDTYSYLVMAACKYT